MENLNRIQTEGEASIDKKSRENPSKVKFLAIIVVVSILVSSSFGAFFGFMAGKISQDIFPGPLQKYTDLFGEKSSPNLSVVREQLIQEDAAIINVVENSSPAVVSIVITKNVPSARNSLEFPFDFPDFFGNPFKENDPNNQGNDTQKRRVGGGTGFFISPDGMIVTNRHVVDDLSAQYSAITNDGREYEAKVIARDSLTDIAIIKVEGDNFSTLNFGDSGSLKIGQTVIAIGNSLGEFSNTVSRGIISGLKRSVTAGSRLGDTERLTDIIQTDAAINPGNSGGPLLDINGNVIGVNVAMAQGAQNIGFAIPGNRTKKIVEQVKATGKISNPFIGVRYVAVDDMLQKNNNLPFNYGALITRGEAVTDFAVIPGGPADKAGIVENDIILEINGTKIDENNTLTDIIAKYNVGDEINLKVWDKGNIKDAKVKLEERK